jgi:hypothetical protein
VKEKCIVNPYITTRRAFLRTGSAVAAGVAAPAIVPSRVFGATAPSNRVALAQIGVGGRGTVHLKSYLELPDVQIVAVCDCFKSRLKKAANTVNTKYAQDTGRPGYKGCDTVGDFRELLARDDIDAVSIATPDHWHVPIAIAAVRAGKDVYVEKPLSVAVAWNQALRTTVNRYGAVFQYGTQQRSSRNFRFACELALNQYIGELERIEAWCPDISSQYDKFNVKQYGSTEPAPVPDDLDFHQWIGPAPMKPYTVDRCTQFGLYHIYDYALGFIAGWGAHPLDIAQWGNDTDDTGPVSYEGKGELPEKGLYDTISKWDVHCQYANGVKMRFMDHRTAEPVVSAYRKYDNHGTTFYGSDGWVSVDRGGIYASSPALLELKLKPNDVHLYDSKSQFGNFAECVKTRSKTINPVESAVQSDIISHISDICIRVGRPIEWDPEKEMIAGDPQATHMLDRPLRSPWTL